MATTTLEQRAVRPPASGDREAPFTPAATGDGWTLDGYGAVFNQHTTIDSWEGRFREQIAPGSMKRSFRETPPKVQFDHGRHPLIGSFPIARVDHIAEETDPVLAPQGGAHVVAPMIRHLFFEPIREAIAVGAINGMSFRFEVVREQWHTADGEPITDDNRLAMLLEQSWRQELPDEELPVRTLRELKVPEIGPVTWPAYEQTSVGVRSTIIDLSSLRNDREQCTLLAKAMWNMAAQENTDDAQQPTDRARSVGEPPSEDAQPATVPVGERPSKTPAVDAQQAAASLAAGTHPSSPTSRHRSMQYVLRNQRDLLATLTDEKRPSTWTPPSRRRSSAPHRP